MNVLAKLAEVPAVEKGILMYQDQAETSNCSEGLAGAGPEHFSRQVLTLDVVGHNVF